MRQLSTWRSVLYLSFTIPVCSLWQSHFRLLVVSCFREDTSLRREGIGTRKGCGAHGKTFASIPLSTVCTDERSPDSSTKDRLQLVWSDSRCQNYSILSFQTSVGFFLFPFVNEIIRHAGERLYEPLLMVSFGNDPLTSVFFVICRKVTKKGQDCPLSWSNA